MAKITGPCEKLLRAHPRDARIHSFTAYKDRAHLHLRETRSAKKLLVSFDQEDVRRLRREIARDLVEVSDAVLELLDAFALDDRSGFTPGQRAALKRLEGAVDRRAARDHRAGQDQAIARVRESTSLHELEGRRFTLDGEAIEDARAWAAQELDRETIRDVAMLTPGQELEVGGGAGASFTLRRIS